MNSRRGLLEVELIKLYKLGNKLKNRTPPLMRESIKVNKILYKPLEAYFRRGINALFLDDL